MTASGCGRCWPGFGSAAADPAGHEPDPAGCWAIRPTPAGAIRAYLRKRRIKATIPEPADQRNNRLRRGRTGGRPPAFDPETYKQRNVVERAINKLKAHRGVATRYDKRDYTFRGTIDLASIRIWLRDPVP